MTRVRARAELVWGGIDQGLSSATNLGLSIVAGRLLGAAGLGLIFLGFSTFILALSVVRGYITAPFVVATSTLERPERDAATRRCMTLVFGAAILVSGLALVIGLFVPDPLGRGLVVFAPWMGVGIIQDQWRSILFRDQRGRAAAFNDGMWAVGMIVMLPFVWLYPNDWSVTATWGAGAALAAVVGVLQVRLRPSGISEAVRWWKRELRPLGSWLAMDSILNAVGSQVTIIILAVVLSASDIGGMRVVQVVFAPMTLVSEAFNFPGIPILTRALAISLTNARVWAWRLGVGAVAIVGAYLALVGLFAPQILARVFGPEFERFTSLVFPTAIGQIPIAVMIGFSILLKADRRGHAIVLVTAIRSVLVLLVTPLMAVEYGVRGAAWGFTIVSFFVAATTIFAGYLSRDVPLRGARFALNRER